MIILKIFIYLVVIILFLSFFVPSMYMFRENGSVTLGNSDFYNHMAHARQTSCFNDINGKLEFYPCGFAFISSPFSYQQETFYVFCLVIILIIIPIILYILFKHWSIILFYLTIGAVYSFDLYSIYPQAIVSILLIVFFLKKNIWIRIAIWLLAMTIHSDAIYLFSVAFFIIYLFEYWVQIKDKIVLMCVPPFSGIIPNSNIPILSKVSIITFSNFGRLFLQNFNFLLIPLAYFGAKSEKRLDWFIFAFMIIGGSLFFNTTRVFFTFCLFLIPCLCWGFQKLSKRWKGFYVVLSIILYILNYYIWFVTKVQILDGC